MPTMLGNKAKMIKKVLFTVIEPSCFSLFSWSGKSVGKTKIALQKFPRILQLLHKVIESIDGPTDYTNVFLLLLKDKIIRHAYEYVVSSYELIIINNNRCIKTNFSYC